MTAADLLSGIIAALSAALLTAFVVLFLAALRTRDQSSGDQP